MKNFYINLYNKIENALYDSKIRKKDVAKQLGISQTALSKQLKQLKNGNGINLKIIKVIEDMTGVDFFCL